jgi:glycosyltransferase involved in cell wall biosynthesis
VPTWDDVLPTVILEAMAAGRPVVGTAVGGVPYLLGTDPSAGWLVAPDAQALAAVLPIARSDAPTVAPAARDRYLRAFHPDVLTGRLIEVYGVLAADCRRAHR